MLTEATVVLLVLIAILAAIIMAYDGKDKKPKPDDNKPNPGTGNIDDLVDEGLEHKGVDVYASWALGPGRDGFFPSKKQRNWLPVLFELKGISAEKFCPRRTLCIRYTGAADRRRHTE